MEYGLSKKQTSLSSDNSGQNILDKFLKLREKDLAMKSFNIDFQHFLAWLSKFLFLCGQLVIFTHCLFILEYKHKIWIFTRRVKKNNNK